MFLFAISDANKGRFVQILAAITATISAVSDGMHYGWTAPAIPILLSEDTPIQIKVFDIVWLENIIMIGGFCGMPITIASVKKFGRKTSILIAAVMNLISWILIGTANTTAQLYVARFLTGMAANYAFVAAPMYIAEIAEQHIRGFLAAFVYLKMLVGIIVVYCVAPFVSIPVSSAVGGAFLVVQLVTFPFMPESPHYLLMRGEKEQARKSLQKLRSKQDVDEELQEISLGVDRQLTERGRVIDMFTTASNRKALLIVIVLNISQHFSGISVLLMNMHTILQDVASAISPNTAAIIFSVLMLVAALIGASVVDLFGRKFLLCISSVFSGLAMALLASYFAAKNAGYDVSSVTWLPVLAVMSYAVAFKCGLGMVPIVITGELFPVSVKAYGMTAAGTFYVLSAIASIYIYQGLMEVFGMHVPFYIFAGFSFLNALFTIYFIPETKGRTLEEIQHILKREK